MPPETVEVKHDEWSAFLNEFTAIHERWLVSLDVMSPEIGAQAEFTDLPLVGATFDAIDGTVLVAAGQSPANHITHAIPAPSRVWIERTDAGADAALCIESADGTKTILRLKTAALPETVDGAVRG
jgi:Family of unknown function (DUF5335)